MQMHDVNAIRPNEAASECALCSRSVKADEALIVHNKPLCNSCVGDVLAQLAADFRRSR